MNETYDIFLSYRREGSEFLPQIIRDRLIARGYSVFLDIESMRSGDFNEQLYNVIDQCTDVILVLPPKGLDRCVDENDWVRKEIAYALNKEKNVIPVMMRNFVFPDQLPGDIAKISRLQGVVANQDYFDAVLERLCNYLNSTPKGTASSQNHLPAGFLHLFDNFEQRWTGLYATFVHTFYFLLFIGMIFCSGFSIINWSKGKASWVFSDMQGGNIVTIVTCLLAVYWLYHEVSRNVVLIQESKNIHPEMLLDSFSDFNNRIIEMDGENMIRKRKGNRLLLPRNFQYTKSYTGLTVASDDGEKIAYIDWHVDRSGTLSFFYLNKRMLRRYVLKKLSKQNLKYIRSKGRFVYFRYEDYEIEIEFTGSILQNIRPLCNVRIYKNDLFEQCC